MARALCDNCGEAILVEVKQMVPGSTMPCPRCSAIIQVGTLILKAEEAVPLAQAAAANGAALDSYRTGLITLRPEEVSDDSSSLEVEVKVKGFLTQHGLPPGSSDYRVRGEATVVGRVEGDIVVDDSAVSTRHFQIEERGAEFFVRDLGSSNGTFVNGRMVRSAHLRTGDQIQAGTTVFTFSVRHTIPM